jgi:hypothetical protein
MPFHANLRNSRNDTIGNDSMVSNCISLYDFLVDTATILALSSLVVVLTIVVDDDDDDCGGGDEKDGDDGENLAEEEETSSSATFSNPSVCRLS